MNYEQFYYYFQLARLQDDYETMIAIGKLMEKLCGDQEEWIVTALKDWTFISEEYNVQTTEDLYNLVNTELSF